MEGEPRKFSPGESSNKPIGGHISSDPFPQALYQLALDRGYDSQLKLSKALGNAGNSPVGGWYRGEHTPGINEFAKLVVLLLPNDELHDYFIDIYGNLLENGVLRAGSETAVARGRKLMKSRPGAFDQWLEQFVKENKRSFRSIAQVTDLPTAAFRPTQVKYPSLDNFSAILQRFPRDLRLSPEQTDELSEAVAQTIEQALASGHHFTGQPGLAIKKVQEQIVCRTYNSVQAAEELGTTHQNVYLLRIKYGLPILLTEEHMDFLKNRPKRSRPKK